MALDAEDRSSNTFALAGVASTYYQLDAAPAPTVYGGPFRLGEGEHLINYYAVDKIDNLGESRSARLRVDSTPPGSALKLNGLSLTPGVTLYANTTDFITLAAADPVSNGVSSGLTTTYFMVDVLPEECEYSEWAGGGINGMGSCENSFYSAPFSLPPGNHTIYYQSVDNVRNMEAGKSMFITVRDKSAAPQESAVRAAEFFNRLSGVLKNAKGGTGERRQNSAVPVSEAPQGRQWPRNGPRNKP